MACSLEELNSFMLLIVNGNHEAISKENLISPIIFLISFFNAIKLLVLERERKTFQR